MSTTTDRDEPDDVIGISQDFGRWFRVCLRGEIPDMSYEDLQKPVVLAALEQLRLALLEAHGERQ